MGALKFAVPARDDRRLQLHGWLAERLRGRCGEGAASAWRALQQQERWRQSTAPAA